MLCAIGSSVWLLKTFAARKDFVALIPCAFVCTSLIWAENSMLLIQLIKEYELKKIVAKIQGPFQAHIRSSFEHATSQMISSIKIIVYFQLVFLNFHSLRRKWLKAIGAKKMWKWELPSILFLVYLVKKNFSIIGSLLKIIWMRYQQNEYLSLHICHLIGKN